MNVKDRNTWTAFRDHDSELIGFKDPGGKVKIEPIFNDFMTAEKFDKIIAVMERNNDTWEDYYLTKSGKKVGHGMIYIFDNMPDCESEGFIRFRDKKTDKTGMYNGDGEIVIPAEYNDLTRVENGLVIALKNARKKYWDQSGHSGCNHYSWVEGKELLIDTKNKIIVENFNNAPGLDLFSLKVTQVPGRDDVRQTFKGVDGQYYSFVDYKKEFRRWLDANVLESVSEEKLINASYKNIYIWKDPDGWVPEPSGNMIHRNFDLIKNRLSGLTRKDADYFISINGLNPYIYDLPEFDIYYTNCREPLKRKYPVMGITINHKTDKDMYQDIFEFLRTESGYKLISMTIRNKTLK